MCHRCSTHPGVHWTMIPPETAHFEKSRACNRLRKRGAATILSAPVQQPIESMLGGGGEMGERMRAFDWSTTALGPLDRWPRSLKISVRIMLDSGYPMAICWGRDYTLLYNDAERSMFGAKHPAALGRSARDVFAEAWESVGALFDRVMTHCQGHTNHIDQHCA